MNSLEGLKKWSKVVISKAGVKKKEEAKMVV
jgi:hypothetical protein